MGWRRDAGSGGGCLCHSNSSEYRYAIDVSGAAGSEGGDGCEGRDFAAGYGDGRRGGRLDGGDYQEPGPVSWEDGDVCESKGIFSRSIYRAGDAIDLYGSGECDRSGGAAVDVADGRGGADAVDGGGEDYFGRAGLDPDAGGEEWIQRGG